MHILKKLRLESKIFLAQTALHLEGIHLNDVDTKDLLTNSTTKCFDVDEEDAIVMRNVVDALNFMASLDFQNITIDLDLYIHLNSILADEQALYTGILRNCPTSIGCIKEDIPVYDKSVIVTEIERLKNINFKNFRQIIPDVFCKLSRMQPFFDGNKRSTNFLCNVALIKKDIGIFYIDYDHLASFNKHLKNYYQGKDNKIIQFIGNELIKTLEDF